VLSRAPGRAVSAPRRAVRAGARWQQRRAYFEFPLPYRPWLGI